MNKYASGYALIRLMSVFGYVVILVSIVLGVVIGVSSPRGMGGYGFVVAIVFSILGAFQGLMILGVGAIGEAILDGSNAQQTANDKFDELIKIMKPKSDEIVVRGYQPSAPSNLDFSKIKPMRSVEDMER